MKKYGILSIQRRIDQSQVTTFDNLYHLVGQNTGNLLFTNAVWNQIAGDKVRVGFTFDPGQLNETLDGLVIPAANWLSPHVDFTKLADLVEGLTIPVVLVGLGAQDQTFSGTIDIPAGTERFVRAVADRSASISVRGHYTKAILERLGIMDVVVTGCPSLYNDFRPFDAPDRVRVRLDKGLLHSTRFSASHVPFAQNKSVHREILRLAYANRIDLLLQSEREEMALLTATDSSSLFDEELRNLLLENYSAPDWASLETFVKSHCRLFFDVDLWSRALEQYDYAFGTRLHGTIMALNSGMPAFMIHHDSRTKELCDFAGIPSADAQTFRLNLNNIRRSIERADFGAYYTRRNINKLTYKKFLQSNRLPARDF
ncbi:MAG: polysaccharide pyruvyl transferase family protein [Alphaproteobacteria bacterium]|nr:polysaccharide pyruvyl transferase family protein [Alphaproteobacteria bacterium]